MRILMIAGAIFAAAVTFATIASAQIARPVGPVEMIYPPHDGVGPALLCAGATPDDVQCETIPGSP